MIMDEEFTKILKRKEYSLEAVNNFFKKINVNEKECHACGKSLIGVGKLVKNSMCYFCMGPVCKECLSTDQMIIPRDFNVKYDLTPKTVCTLAKAFMERKCFIPISLSHP